LVVECEHGEIKKNDILLEIEGKKIANDGSIELRNFERIEYTYMHLNKHINEFTNFLVKRGSEIINIKQEMQSFSNLVPRINIFDWFLFFIN
jgi:hypothetical protein